MWEMTILIIAGILSFLLIIHKLRRSFSLKTRGCRCNMVHHCRANNICHTTLLSLDMINPGETGSVIKLNASGSLRQRLLAMGLTPGIHVRLIKKAPLGDPLEIKLRDFNLSIRKEEAKHIFLSRV